MADQGGLMRKPMHFILPAALLLCGVGTTGAQHGPTQGVIPITEARGLVRATDDQRVKLRGTIVKQERGNQYVFTDGTGNVLVEISDTLLKGNKLSAGTEIEIEGTVDTRARDPKIEARSVTLL